MASEGKSGMYHPEYSKMKFCETFSISPMEYDLLPSKTVRLWSQMKSIENNWEQGRVSLEEDKIKDGTKRSKSSNRIRR